VFALYVGVGGRIQTVEADGTKRQTVFAPGYGFSPYGTVFSPDGKKIAFENYQSVKNVDDIWTIGAHGKNPTEVTRSGAAGRWEGGPDSGPRP